MGFHLFYCHAALLFALGVIDVATITPYDVTAITGGDFFDGPGCFVFYPNSYEFEYIPKRLHHYEEIKDALVQAGNDRDMLLAEGSNRDMLFRAYYLMSASLDMTDVDSFKNEGADFFYRHKITSYSYCNVDNSLQFQYDFDNYKGMREVEVIFSDDAGLRAITDILAEAGITCKNEYLM